MLVCMDPSSPPVKRTLHLLKTPDILLANDTGLPGGYFIDNSLALKAVGSQPNGIIQRYVIAWRAPSDSKPQT